MRRAHRPCAGWLLPCLTATHDCFLGCKILCTKTFFGCPLYCLAVSAFSSPALFLAIHSHPQQAFWQCIFPHSTLPGIAFSSPATLLVVQSHPQPRDTVWSLATFSIVHHRPQPPPWPYCCIHNHLLECTLSFKAMSSCSNAFLHRKLLWHTFWVFVACHWTGYAQARGEG